MKIKFEKIFKIKMNKNFNIKTFISIHLIIQ